MSSKQFGALVLAAVSFAGATAHAAGFDDKARAEFFSGFAGDQAALERGMKQAEETIAANSADAAEALAWHGGALMSMSGKKFQAGDFAAGGELWARGVGEMEKAGALRPDDPAVLVPRAAVWFGVSRQAPPDRAKPLLEKAIADYEHVYDLQKDYFDKLNIHMRSELLFGLADGYERDGKPDKAREWFAKLAAIGPSGHFDQAKQYLNGQKYTIQGLGCVGCHTEGKLAFRDPR